MDQTELGGHDLVTGQSSNGHPMTSSISEDRLSVPADVNVDTAYLPICPGIELLTCHQPGLTSNLFIQEIKLPVPVDHILTATAAVLRTVHIDLCGDLVDDPRLFPGDPVLPMAYAGEHFAVLVQGSGGDIPVTSKDLTGIAAVV